MIPEIERKAVLALFPYFNQKHPSIIDVGSNKGDWASILVENVSVARLFEPNELLLHYSQVRFRHIRHIWYNALAVSDTHDEIEFIYFEDEHDGLSNIIGNDRWDYLHPMRKKVKCVPLSAIAGRDTVASIVKIDVEGAELKVLKGAEMILERKNFKFIEVEYANHIEVTGYKFQDIMDYLARFDYAPFHYDGDQFVPFTDQQAENVFFMDKNFSFDWNKEFIANTKDMKVNFVLEIGAFEGLTSKYICENLLNPGGRMIAVDPLTDEYLPGHKDNEIFKGQYERFIRNTRGLPVELIRKKSSEVYEEMKDYRFDLIYVDGDHTEEQVYRDGMLAFELCRVGGFILFDDYQGYDEGTTKGINRVLAGLMIWKYRVVHKGYQLCLEKLEN